MACRTPRIAILPVLVTLLVVSTLSVPSRPAHARSLAAPFNDVLVLRNGVGANATLLVQAITDAGATPVALPLGLLDHSGRLLYVADAGVRGNTLQVLDATTGRTLRQMRLPGPFSTRSGDTAIGASPLPFSASTFGRLQGAARFTPASSVAQPVAAPDRGAPPADGSEMLSALSFNGCWLALRDTLSRQSATFAGERTHFIVVDTLRLDGRGGLMFVGTFPRVARRNGFFIG